MSHFRRLFRRPADTRRHRARPILDPSAYAAIYAIGDIHGCIDLLRAAYANILRDAAGLSGQKLVVFLGDYVDRGPDSKAVVDFLLKPAPEGIEHVCLCGNHDDEFLAFLHNPKANRAWLQELGGAQTLRSYGIDVEHVMKSGGGMPVLERIVKQAVPASHAEFLAALPSALEIGTLVFVHAGIRPGVALAKQTDRDLLWIREPFLTTGPDLPVQIVHGHTIFPEPVFATRRVCIDTGAFATGRLTVLKIALGKAVVLQ